MLGFEGDLWSIYGNLPSSDPDDPTGALAKPYKDRLSAVSKRYKYMTDDSGYPDANQNGIPGSTKTRGYTGVVDHFNRLISRGLDEEKTLMIELEYPWLAILQRLDSQGINSDWLTETYEGDPIPQEIRDEFDRQSAMGVSYLSGGLTPGSSGTTLTTFKEVTKRLYRDTAQYAKDNGAENVIHFLTHGIPFVSESSVVPYMGMRYEPTLDGRSWWGARSSYPTLEERYEQAMPGGVKGTFADLTEASISSDANVMQLYNLVANASNANAADYWSADSNISRLVPDEFGAGGSAAAATDFNLDDLNYWSKMTFAGSTYLFRNKLQYLYDNSYDVEPNKPLATIIVPDSYPISVGGNDGGFVLNNRWVYRKDPSVFGEVDIAGLFAGSDANVPNTSYPDQIWIWTAGWFYGISIPTGRAFGGTGNAIDEFVVLTSRCQLEKTLFGRTEMQTVAEGGLSSEAELVSSTPNGADSGLVERRRAWLRANTLPNVYWDGRYFYTDNGNTIWYSEGVTNNVRYWSAATGNQLPSPLTFDRNSALAPWLNFNNDIYKNDVRVALKHYRSEQNVSAIENAYKTLNNIGIAPLVD
jgi:hypothetical protein